MMISLETVACVYLSESVCQSVYICTSYNVCLSVCVCVFMCVMDGCSIHPTWVPRFVPKRTKRRRTTHNTRNLERLYANWTTILFQVLVVHNHDLEPTSLAISQIFTFEPHPFGCLLRLTISFESLFFHALMFGGVGLHLQITVCPVEVEGSSRNQLLWCWWSCVCFRLCRIICWSCLVIMAGALPFWADTQLIP